MPSYPGHRFDLPASRVLCRALRSTRQLSSRLARRIPCLSPVRQAELARTLILDLIFFRLAEDRAILPPHFFERNASRMPPVLTQLNQRLGFPLFTPELYSESDDEREVLLAWDQELHLRKFWPPEMPLEVLGVLAQVVQPETLPAGGYWTPARIIALLLDWTLDPEFTTAPLPARSSFTLLDPACGAGLFLLAALRRLIQAEEKADRTRSDLFAPVLAGPGGERRLTPLRKVELFSEHLFGVDADEFALAAARRILLLLMLEGVSLLDQTPPSTAALFTNLRLGDSLVDQAVALQEDMFRSSGTRKILPFPWSDPERGFGGVLPPEGVSALVGNPPWGALKGKQLRPAYPPEVVEFLIRRYQADSYRPSLFEVFIRRSVELLAEGGVQALVVPERLVSHPQFLGLRRFLTEQGELLNLHLGEPFPGVPGALVCYRFRKTKRPRKTRPIAVSDPAGRSSTLSLRQWLRPESLRLSSRRDPQIQELLAQIERAPRKRLNEFMESGVGLIARPGKLTAERISPNQQAVVRGEHVGPYHRQGRSWLEFIRKNLAGGTRKLDKLSRRDRILVRKIGARLAATRDDSGDLVEQSLFFLHLRNRRLCRGYDLSYFLGLLNSRVLGFYYRYRLAKNPGAYPQLKKTVLDRFPIPTLRRSDPDSVEAYRQLVAAALRRLQAGAEGDPELDLVIERQAAKLYGLSESALQTILADDARR